MYDELLNVPFLPLLLFLSLFLSPLPPSLPLPPSPSLLSLFLSLRPSLPLFFSPSLPPSLSLRITTLPYTHKDQVGDYTMLAGDIIHFSIAVDKRNGTVSATNVTMHKLIESQRQTKDRETVRVWRDGRSLSLSLFVSVSLSLSLSLSDSLPPSFPLSLSPSLPPFLSPSLSLSLPPSQKQKRTNL